MTRCAETAFVSYSREDSEFALRLIGDLKAAGASVWLDQLDIVPGQRWDGAVEDALKSCPSMIVILSPASVSSQNVMDEVNFALRKKKTVIPIIYQDCEVPFRLDRLQHVDFSHDYPRGLQKLLTTLAVAQSGDDCSKAVTGVVSDTSHGRAGLLDLENGPQSTSPAATLPGMSTAPHQLPHALPESQPSQKKVETVVEPPVPYAKECESPRRNIRWKCIGRTNKRTRILWICFAMACSGMLLKQLLDFRFSDPIEWIIGLSGLGTSLALLADGSRSLRVLFEPPSRVVDAYRLLRALEKTGYAKGKTADVLLANDSAGPVVSFVVQEGNWEKPDQLGAYEAILRKIAPSAGGLPLRAKLVDHQLQPKKEFTVR